VDHRARSVFRRGQVVLALVLAAAVTAWAGNRHDVSFTYSVSQEPGSGSLVHVSLRLSLTNHGKDPVSIRKVVVRHIHMGQAQQFSPVTVQPHSSQQVTQQLTLSRPEFERWQKDIGSKLVLEVQSPGNKFVQAIQPDKLQVEK